MKKTISLVLVLCICTMFFAGCGSDDDISALIDTAFANAKKLKYSNTESTTDVIMEYNTYSVNTKTETSIQQSNIDNLDKYEMSLESTVKSADSSSTYEAYVKDGFYYTDKYGGKFKSKFNKKDFSNVSMSELTLIEYKDMRTVEIGDLENGGKKISFSCKNSVIRNYIEKSYDQSGEEVNVKTNNGYYKINKNGFLTAEYLTVVAELTKDAETTKIKITSKVEYKDINKKVDPFDPEDGDYTEVNDLSLVGEIFNGISNVTTLSDSNITSESSATINYEKNTYGYNRKYVRQLSAENSTYLKDVTTEYNQEGKDIGDVVSAEYYTDGKFYNRSDTYNHKIYSDVTFAEFYSKILPVSNTTPMHVYGTGIMKDITKKETKNGSEYTFGLNDANTEYKQLFLEWIFAPYESTFNGDCSAAKLKIKSFNATNYLNKNGDYYKTVLSCDMKVTFDEGSFNVKFNNTVNVNNIGKPVISKFPKLKGYTFMDKAELFTAFSGDIGTFGTENASSQG